MEGLKEYILKEDAVAAVMETDPHVFLTYNKKKETTEIVVAQITEEVLEEINKIPAADVAPRWIPVAERLPEEDYETGNGVQFSADVLATIVNHANDGELYCWLLKTVDGKWYDYVPNWEGEHEIPHWCEVIAWMPLPSPYKEGDQNG